MSMIVETLRARAETHRDALHPDVELYEVLEKLDGLVSSPPCPGPHVIAVFQHFDLADEHRALLHNVEHLELLDTCNRHAHWQLPELLISYSYSLLTRVHQVRNLDL